MGFKGLKNFLFFKIKKKGEFNYKQEPSANSFFSFSQLKKTAFFQNLTTVYQKTFLFVKKQKVLLVIIVFAFLASDLLVIKGYEYLMPEKKIPPRQIVVSKLTPSREDYKNVWEQNIFHEGAIPLKLVDKGEVSSSEDPVKSALPFQLKGTIVHLNAYKSVATVHDDQNESSSYGVGDVISKQARVTGIERGKLVFFNLNNNRLEFIQLPEEQSNINISYQNKKRPSVSRDQTRLVKRTGNRFEVNRSDINDYLNNIHEVLQQARVIPERDQSGAITGYSFATIDKDSIYGDLGFKEGDVIKSVNGESVTNPQKALELFDRLRTSSGIKILVQRDGKEVEYEYGVSEDAPMTL